VRGDALAGSVWLAVRPEKIVLNASGEASTDNALSGEIAEVAYLGERSLFHVRLPTGKIVSVIAVNMLRSGPHFRAGDRVALSWPAEAGTLLAS
jgi:putrescine transport system ATP-binding protein